MHPRHSSFVILWAIAALILASPHRGGAEPPAIPPANAAERQRADDLFQRLRESEIRPLDANRFLALLTVSLRKADTPSTQAALLRGMLSGLEGRRDVPAPEGWSELSKTLAGSSDPDIVQMTLRLGQIFGDEAANERALATLRDEKAPIAGRKAALQSLVTQRYAGLASELESLINDDALRLDAIRAYASFSESEAPGVLLSHYSRFDAAARRAIIETLATRKEYAQQLVAALKNGEITRDAIPTYAARSLRNLLGESFTGVYGRLEDLSQDKEDLIARYTTLLTDEALSKASPRAGRAVFERTCSACHLLYGGGGKIGPDLTGSNRGDVAYILLNMLDPSGDIPEAYQLVTLTTVDGQVLAGTVAAEDDQRVVLNSVGLQSTVLKSDIQSRETSPYSMMPEGLLLTLPDSDVVDLVKYLRTTQQVDLPK